MRGHVRKRGARWAVVLDAGRDAAGKRKQKWVGGFRTREEAEDALVDLLGKRLRGKTVDPDRTPVAAYLSRWLDGRVGRLAPLSIAQHRSVIRNHVRDAARQGSACSHPRSRRRTRAKGLAPATRNTVRAVLSSGFADALEDDLIGVDPTIRKASRRESTALTPRRFTVWTGDELCALLETAEGERLGAL